MRWRAIESPGSSVGSSFLSSWSLGTSAGWAHFAPLDCASGVPRYGPATLCKGSAGGWGARDSVAEWCECGCPSGSGHAAAKRSLSVTTWTSVSSRARLRRCWRRCWASLSGGRTGVDRRATAARAAQALPDRVDRRCGRGLGARCPIAPGSRSLGSAALVDARGGRFMWNRVHSPASFDGADPDSDTRRGEELNPEHDQHEDLGRRGGRGHYAGDDGQDA